MAVAGSVSDYTVCLRLVCLTAAALCWARFINRRVCENDRILMLHGGHDARSAMHTCISVNAYTTYASRDAMRVCTCVHAVVHVIVNDSCTMDIATTTNASAIETKIYECFTSFPSDSMHAQHT